MSSKVILLIPSYQPTVLFCELLEEFRQMDPTPVVVVDDGSGSAYSELFQRAARVRDIVVLKNAVNLGKGAALKHGMNHVLVNYPDCTGVVTADADGQHLADDILKVATELQSRSTEVIFGSRDFKRDVPFRSKIGNLVSRYVYRFLVGLKLSDTQTGLRGIPRRLMELSLGIRSNRYEFETEQIIVAKTASFKFKEVPIQTVYINDNSGSHFNPVLDSFRIYFVLLRYTLSSIATALTDFVVFYILTANGMALLSANMSARAVALWLQFLLLKAYVFKSKAGISIFAAYVAYVFFSGYLSAAMQAQFAGHFVDSPLLAKVVVESVIWIFNFMFLRDIIFRKWSEA
jgi:glycosyltransferase involved in cell wall biosynthesis